MKMRISALEVIIMKLEVDLFLLAGQQHPKHTCKGESAEPEHHQTLGKQKPVITIKYKLWLDITKKTGSQRNGTNDQMMVVGQLLEFGTTCLS